MLTIEMIDEYGADIKDGLVRCMGNEALYLKLVAMVIDEKAFEELETALENGDTNAAFMSAHALKGVLANLSLDPILEPVSELTEKLRRGSKEDHSDLLEEIKAQRTRLAELCA